MKRNSDPFTKQELLESLCLHDSRNPDCVYSEEENKEYHEDLEKKDTMCYCDNCFGGRAALAEEVLRCHLIIKELKQK